jgi:Asp/Glu/hydantoin racemase
MEKRFSDLGNYAESIGADGILFTCSAFGPAIDKVAYNLTIPVLKPNEAMFEQALNTGHKIGMLATFGQSIASMSKEFCEIRNSLSATGSLDTKLVEGAMEFLRQGNQTKHNELIAKTAATFKHCDVLMLAQFSMVSAKSAVFRELNVPVLTAPEAAVKKLRGILMQ